MPYQDRHLDLTLTRDHDEANRQPVDAAAASERRLLMVVALTAVTSIALAVRAALGLG